MLFPQRVKIAAVLFGLLPVLSQADVGLGLPSVETSPERLVELGKKLFFDRRLSVNNTLSCAMCHIPEQGFAQNQLATPVGLEGRVLKRNSPSLLNVRYRQSLFHDGREYSLVNQVWSPLLSEREMGNLSIGMVIGRLKELDDYSTEFAETLGDIDAVTIGEALAAYQQSLIAGDSPFDRWYFGGDELAVEEAVKRGFILFQEKGCIACHQLGDKTALFTDHSFRNTGIGYEQSMGLKPGQRTIRLTDTVTIQTDVKFEGDVHNDLGRYEVTGEPEDRWRYRTAGLRNIALTAPYMHDGSISSLAAVLEFYSNGGVSNPGLDPLVKPFSLTSAEAEEMIVFLNSLTSSHIPRIVKSTRGSAAGAN